MALKHRVFALVLSLALLCGCGASQKAPDAAVEFFAMDTLMRVLVPGAGDALLQDVRGLAEGLEARLSVTREGSEIYTLNHTGAASLSPETAGLVRRAQALCAETGGALDISIYPVLRAWGFTTGEYRVPEAAELEALLARVDYAKLTLSGSGEAALPDGMEIDLGSVAKGYAGDRICALLRDSGAESALLDLGGNIQALGGKPDGSPWRVGVRDPGGEGLLGVLPIRDEAVVTSGGYERCFTDDAGNLWWHILDPADGFPARNGLVSVTVVGTEGLYCDALSTALFVLGPERAIQFWRSHGDFDMLLVTESGTLLLTPELAERFTPDRALSYAIEVIENA